MSWKEAALSNKALKISLFFGCRDTCAFALMQTSAARKGGLSYFSPSQDINLVSVLQSPKLPHISLENIPEQRLQVLSLGRQRVDFCLRFIPAVCGDRKYAISQRDFTYQSFRQPFVST